jgi:hypothetical protein
MKAARVIAALGALVGLGGLALQYVIMVSADGAAPLETTWRFFAYFTILTNCLVTLVFTRAALKPDAGDGLNAPRVELMALTSIVFVCAVYNVLLAPRWAPEGWQLVADIIVHQVVPALFVMFWLSRPRGRLGWGDAMFAALWPIGYAAYGLTRGAFDGFYLYFFMDPTAAPLWRVALNMSVLTAVVLAGALGVIAIDRALARRRAAA